MDKLDEMLLAEIRHIQDRLRLMSQEILNIIEQEPVGYSNLTVEDSLILKEIADGFDEEIGLTSQKPILKVVPKPDAH